MPSGSQVACAWRPPDTCLDRSSEHLELADHLLGDLCLNGEDVTDWPVPSVRPYLGTCPGVTQPGGRADLVALSLDRAVKDEVNIQIASDLPHIGRPALVDLG